MNEQTKSGLKIGGLLTILVGVISLIVVIPTIQTLMKPKLKEYHFKFDTNFNWSMFYADQLITFEVVNEQNTFANYNVSGKYITIILFDLDSYVNDSDYIMLSDAEAANSLPYDYSTMNYGLLDFTNITNFVEGMELLPNYTPLYA